MEHQTQENNSQRVQAGITLRPVCADDEAFLLKVYASTRREEFASIPWTAAQLEAFLRMQFVAQRRDYETQYPKADHRIILFNDELAGRIMTAGTDEGIYLVDISLLPEYRNRGLGTNLIGNLLADAEREGVSVHLQVLQTNPARQLYERLAFSIIGEHDFYSRMLWRPKNRASG
jgi:ribosomal protein S18 acetylase RimI-like enzyme